MIAAQMRPALVAALLSLSSVAAEAQVAIDGRPPEPIPSVLGPTDGIALYEERTRFTLDADMPIDVPAEPGTYTLPVGGSIAAGTLLSCYLVHFEDALPATATVTIGPRLRLLGVVASDGRLDRWDEVCRPREEITYPTGDSSRGGITSGDFVVIGADGGTLDFEFTMGSSELDQARILVAPVDPVDAGTAERRDAGASDPWDYRGSGGCTCSAAGSSAPHAPAGLFILVLALTARCAAASSPWRRAPECRRLGRSARRQSSRRADRRRP